MRYISLKFTEELWNKFLQTLEHTSSGNPEDFRSITETYAQISDNEPQATLMVTQNNIKGLTPFMTLLSFAVDQVAPNLTTPSQNDGNQNEIIISFDYESWKRFLRTLKKVRDATGSDYRIGLKNDTLELVVDSDSVKKSRLLLPTIALAIGLFSTSDNGV